MSLPAQNAGIPMRRSVLVVDDEPGIRTALTAHFTREGWQVVAASGVHEAEYRLSQAEFDLLVSDVRLPDGSGAELLRAAQATPVVLMTAFATVPDAVEAMRCGARDYLTKPVAWTELREAAERFAGVDAAPAADEGRAGGIVGRAPALIETLGRARAAALTGAPVLIEGEAGTGKKLLARYIHGASDRAARPFVAVDCGSPAVDEELFGAPGRVGKLELAHGGVLLLHAVHAMPLATQARLLHALEKRGVERAGEPHSVELDICVLSTTDCALGAAADRGAFRSGLFYRLSTVALELPPLRERKDDIPLLAAHFARVWAAREGRRTPAVTPEALASLAGGHWPENIRELERRLNRAFSALRPEEAAVQIASVVEAAEGGVVGPAHGTVAPVPIRELERMHLERTLELTRGNRTHAAEMLGISLRTVRNKIREYGLPPRRYA